MYREKKSRKVTVIAAMALAWVVSAGSLARAESSSAWLNLGSSLQAAVAEAEDAAPAPAAPAKLPISFGFEYSVVTDYIFRGVNYSEYAGEGRERLNHQLGVWLEYDTGQCGVFGAYIWFEWFPGQNHQIDGAASLLENDYILYWRYAIPNTPVTVELGWAAYVYPEYTGDWKTTYEVYTKVSLDDSSLFGTKKAVLNPYISYYHDIDVVQGGWLEIGINHTFALADCPVLGDLAVLKHMSVKPSLALGVDHRYLPNALGTGQASTKLGTLVYGLEVSCDLNAALKIPADCGAYSISGFMNYSQALRDKLIEDEFWGGVKLSGSW